MEEENNKGILKNWIVKNLIGAVVFFLAVAIGATMFLNFITNHGKTVEVPDFTGMSVSEAKTEAKHNGLRLEVIDSIYVKRMEKGAIFSQTPKSGTSVKKRRRILLTINAVTAKKVTMPNLVGLSMRQAKAELNSRGLTVGKLTYVNDIATNNVISQTYRNRSIKAGKQIDSGSEIDLILGLNSTDNQTYIPDVKGLKYIRAVDAIKENSLNVRKVVFDKNVKTYSDSSKAEVYKQSPEASAAPTLMGSEVSIYLRLKASDNEEEKQ